MKISFQGAYQKALDIAAFTGVGYLCSRALRQLTDKESRSLAACCALFITIDRFAQKFLHACVEEDDAREPLTVGFRVVLSAAGAIMTFNQLARFTDLPKVEVKLAATIIGISVVVYNLLCKCLVDHQERGDQLGYKKAQSKFEDIFDDVSADVTSKAKRLYEKAKAI